MGQVIDKDNSFRTAIIQGLLDCDVGLSNHPLYKDVNYGLIIKPLNMDYNFREPIRMFFKGYPFHVGVIKDDRIYSFCPDLMEPHRGTLQKDIIKETLDDWIGGEIFWFVNKKKIYQQIEARLIDILKVNKGLLDLGEFNRRHGTSLKMLYNLLSNNCTDVALSILIGQTRCFQIESIAEIIHKFKNMKELLALVPDYVRVWLLDFKY